MIISVITIGDGVGGVQIALHPVTPLRSYNYIVHVRVHTPHNETACRADCKVNKIITKEVSIYVYSDRLRSLTL